MKTTIKTTLALLALGVSTLALSAQDNGGGPPDGGPPNGQGGQGRHRPPPLPLVQALDVNHDGIIESNEIANASAELLTLDKNGDGQLTPDEYMPPRPQQGTNSTGRTFHGPRIPIVEALDVNHDGTIDSNEIANASTELLTLDKNGDGQLTPDEYRPHHPHGMGGPPDGGNSSDDGPHGPPMDGNGDPGDGGPPGPPPGDDSSQGGPPGPPPNQ